MHQNRAMTLDCLPFMWSETSRYSAIRTIYTKWNRITIHNIHRDILVACRFMNHAVAASTYSFCFFTFHKCEAEWGRSLCVRITMPNQVCAWSHNVASFHRTGTSFRRRRISFAIYIWSGLNAFYIYFCKFHYSANDVHVMFKLIFCHVVYSVAPRILLHLYLFI